MLRFVDGFDHYVTADLQKKWTTVNFSPTITVGAGSCLSQGCRFNAFDQLVKGLPFSTDTVGFGHRVIINEADTGVSILMGATGHATARHLLVYRHYDGSLSVYRNDAVSGLSTTLLGTTAADVVRVGDAYFLEFKAKHHATLGTVDMRVNGVSVMALTGKNTLGASASVTSFWLGNENGNGSSETDIDDIHVYDSAAGDVTTFIGPTRVEWLKPDAVGSYIANFSLVGAATQWQAVRDASGPDGDTTYVQSATVNHKHSSNFEGTGLPAGSIFGVQVNLTSRITDAGYRGIKPLIVQGADYLGTEQFPGASYRDLHEVFEHDPATGAAWLIAGVNSAEFGAKVTT